MVIIGSFLDTEANATTYKQQVGLKQEMLSLKLLLTDKATTFSFTSPIAFLCQILLIFVPLLLNKVYFWLVLAAVITVNRSHC